MHHSHTVAQHGGFQSSRCPGAACSTGICVPPIDKVNHLRRPSTLSLNVPSRATPKQRALRHFRAVVIRNFTAAVNAHHGDHRIMHLYFTITTGAWAMLHRSAIPCLLLTQPPKTNPPTHHSLWPAGVPVRGGTTQHQPILAASLAHCQAAAQVWCLL